MALIHVVGYTLYSGGFTPLTPLDCFDAGYTSNVVDYMRPKEKSSLMVDPKELKKERRI
jgi:hypothetical protein